ncbi:MAG: hypothetical protein ACR2PI_04560, partial [Hyphomicrobiaceae bacterium]
DEVETDGGEEWKGLDGFVYRFNSVPIEIMTVSRNPPRNCRRRYRADRNGCALLRTLAQRRQSLSLVPQ